MSTMTIRVYQRGEAVRKHEVVQPRGVARGDVWANPMAYPPCECPRHRATQQQQED